MGIWMDLTNCVKTLKNNKYNHNFLQKKRDYFISDSVRDLKNKSNILLFFPCAAYNHTHNIHMVLNNYLVFNQASKDPDFVLSCFKYIQDEDQRKWNAESDRLQIKMRKEKNWGCDF